MPFQPKPGLQITEHPYAPGLPYGQEGRAATVYKLVAEAGVVRALKVFKPIYRVPALAGQAVALAPLAQLPALQVCARTVLSALRHPQLLQAYPELLYAVLMPWIEGPTWFDVVMDHREISAEQSLGLARGLLAAFVAMEEREIAHCDLSGPNLILPGLLGNASGSTAQPVELVDVEQLYGSGLRRPERLTVGTAGYAHRSSPDHLWGREADRFAGAILITELLGWCMPAVRDAAWDGSYFDQAEVQKDSKRYQLLTDALSSEWGQGVADLLNRAWLSEALEECPTFEEWTEALASGVGSGGAQRDRRDGEQSFVSTALYNLARELEQQEDYAGAATTYRHLRRAVEHQAGSVAYLDASIRRLDARTATADAAESATATAEQSHDPLADLFDDGLSAYQKEEWPDAKELLGEVVRQQPAYVRAGWEARKLLEYARRQSRPRWLKIVRYGGRILASAILVTLLVAAAFVWTYLTFVRPVVTASIFTFTRPLLHELTDISGGGGCWTVTEEELNQDLTERVPALVDSNDMKIGITEDAFRASMEIAGYSIWVDLYPPDGVRGQDFALERVEMSDGLKVLFSPEDLAGFTDEYVRSEVLGPDGMSTLSLDPADGQVEVCANR